MYNVGHAHKLTTLYQSHSWLHSYYIGRLQYRVHGSRWGLVYNCWLYWQALLGLLAILYNIKSGRCILSCSFSYIVVMWCASTICWHHNNVIPAIIITIYSGIVDHRYINHKIEHNALCTCTGTLPADEAWFSNSIVTNKNDLEDVIILHPSATISEC